MDTDTWWYIRAYGLFFLFNAAAILGVLLFHKRKWNVELMQFRHYTSLVFQICGIIYALFLSFIVWDVWERYYEVKRMVQDEAKYLVDIHRDSHVFEGEQGAIFRERLKDYLEHLTHVEWHNMEDQDVREGGDQLVNGIWQAYYDYTPQTEKDRIWYRESIDKLNEMTNARLTRLFNNRSSVGIMRWLLLLIGGLFLISMPSFFDIDQLFFKLLLVLFLANIIAFMLFIIFSLDHPFVGHIEIHPTPLEYALKAFMQS